MNNEFAVEWIATWNSHNIDEILKLYSEDIEVCSPKIQLFLQKEIGTLKGKAAVKDYWTKALVKVPDLHFTLQDVAYGINSVTLYYQSSMGNRAMEVMFFDDNGLVNKMFAHYTP